MSRDFDLDDILSEFRDPEPESGAPAFEEPDMACVQMQRPVLPGAVQIQELAHGIDRQPEPAAENQPVLRRVDIASVGGEILTPGLALHPEPVQREGKALPVAAPVHGDVKERTQRFEVDIDHVAPGPGAAAQQPVEVHRHRLRPLRCGDRRKRGQSIIREGGGTRGQEQYQREHRA